MNCNCHRCREACESPNCPHEGTWEHPEGSWWCEGHSKEFLMSEDREDFAEEWAVEEKRERELAWQEGPR